MAIRNIDISPGSLRLCDGRSVLLRHGAAGDEMGIARVVTGAFPVYNRATRGNAQRAA